MSTVATISIKLDAQTAALKKGFREVKTETQSLSAAVQKGIGSGIVRFQAWLATIQQVGNAITNLLGQFRTAISRIAAVGDITERIGADPERFQRLQATVEQFGANADQLGVSLQRMSRRMADAANNGGPLAERMRSLGINVERFSKMGPVDMFLELSEAMRQSDITGEQLAAVFANLDMEGAQFAEAMRLGRDELERLMDAQDDFLFFDRQDIERARELDGQLTKLDRTFMSLKGNIALIVGPFFEAFVKGFDRVVKAADHLRSVLYRLGKILGTGAYATIFGKGARAIGVAGDGSIRLISDSDGAGGGTGTLPSIGAVTSTTVQGFSAYQQQRRMLDRENWEKAMLRAMDRLIRVTEAGPSFTEVNL